MGVPVPLSSNPEMGGRVALMYELSKCDSAFRFPRDSSRGGSLILSGVKQWYILIYLASQCRRPLPFFFTQPDANAKTIQEVFFEEQHIRKQSRSRRASR